MKYFKRYLGFAIICALLTTSCSKDSEIDEPVDPTAKSTLSFATMLNDIMNAKAALKQEMGSLPECSDAVPDHVAIVLTGPETLGSMADPYEIAVNPASGDYDEDPDLEYFTQYDPNLELPPGNYTLEYFVVYDSMGNIIWTAPTESGEFALFVDNPLPIEIDLDAGVKKYVEVEVLCFDDREVNKYGYLFFDIETTELYEYCFFINYCNEYGRHFPASYTVDVWLGTDASGIPLYESFANYVARYEESDEPYAEPLCLLLPNLDQFEDDEVYLYYEITLQDWTGVYGDVDQDVITGTLTRAEIESNFVDDDTMDYEHLGFGCEGPDNGGEEPEDTDSDGVPDTEDQCPGHDDNIDTDEDGVADGCDECPEEDGTYETNGCADIGEPPVDSDGDGVPDTEDECPGNDDTVDTDSDGIADGCDNCPDDAGTLENGGCPAEPTDSDGDGVPDTEDQCNGFDDTIDTDSDGIPDGCDNCPNEVGPADNNGCPDEVELCTIEEPEGDCTSALLQGTAGFWTISQNMPLELFVDGEVIGVVTVAVDGNGGLVVSSNLAVEAGFLWSGYQIYISSGGGATGIYASTCGAVDPSGSLRVDFGNIDAAYPLQIQLKANVCPANPN